MVALPKLWGELVNIIPRKARAEAERARFIILSVKELGRDQISSGIYGHISRLVIKLYGGITLHGTLVA